MEFELTNHQRAYFGLKKVQDHWEKIKLTDEIYLYFDGNTIVKSIAISEGSYTEDEMNEETENRETLLPKTKRGKPKKLNFSSFQSRNGIGTYFSYSSRTGVTIGNYTTQRTFYSTHFEEIEIPTFESLQQWIKNYIEESTEEDTLEIEAFSNEKRKRVKIKEGDFFCFKVDRRNYGFGRVLLDIRKLRKEKAFEKKKHYGLAQLMGQALTVKVYHKISADKYVNIEELKHLKSFPSQYIMDNQLFYGDCEIIGHLNLESNELNFPISYSKSINHSDKNTVYLQWGLIYEATDVSKFDKYLSAENPFATNEYSKIIENPYRNEGIGFGISLNKKTLEKCILENSNTPYWEEKSYLQHWDLRSLKNKNVREEILKQFGLKPTLEYFENLIEK